MRAMVERANLGEVEMELITHAHTLNHQPLHLGGGGGGGGGGSINAMRLQSGRLALGG